jgi:hypothetical protein
MTRLLDRLIPRSALAWDWDRPFCEDRHIRSDARYAALYRVCDLFPLVRVQREPIIFSRGPWS